MKPKRTIVVVGHQGELRATLRIALQAVNILPAEDMAQFKRYFARGLWVDLIIIDRREAPTLAKRVTQYCLATMPAIRTITIASYREPLKDGEQNGDLLMRDGIHFIERLLNSVVIGLARKRGPAKGCHQLCR